MLMWTAFALFVAALLLFLGSRRIRNRGEVQGEVILGDNREEECPVLVSHRYGLRGKLDALVRMPNGTLMPIERKSTKAPLRPYDSDRIQAAAYCMLVEDNYGQTPPFARIEYADHWFDEPFTDQHRQWVLDVSAQLRMARQAGNCRRSHNMPGKCRGCGHQLNCGQALTY